MKRANRRFIPVLALVLGASISALPYAAAAAQPTENDTNLQAEVMNKALNKANLKDVQATAQERCRYLDRNRTTLRPEARGG